MCLNSQAAVQLLSVKISIFEICNTNCGCYGTALADVDTFKELVLGMCCFSSDFWRQSCCGYLADCLLTSTYAKMQLSHIS